MKLYSTWKFHCDTLQFICLKSNLLCSLAAAIHIGSYIRIWKAHLNIWNIWLRNTVIVQFHSKCFCFAACTGKSRISAVGIRCCQMHQNKSCSCAQISIAILFCKKSIIARSLCAVIADFRKFLTITQLGNIISSTSWTGFFRLNTVSSSRNTSKLYSILISQITSVTIIRILIAGSSCYCYFLGACRRCYPCHKSNWFPFI